MDWQRLAQTETMTSFLRESPRTRPTEFRQAANGKTRILMVDDNLPFLELYSESLRDAGYEVLTATNGSQALRLIRNEVPDLVVLDVVLPGLSGIEICRKIRADPNLRDLFVVLISGQAVSAEQTVDGLAIGADEYLFKPLSLSEFKARIRTLVRLTETAAALRASEQHYRGLVEILPDAVALIDRRFQLLGVNERAAAMLGYANASELLGKNAIELIHATDRDRFRADMAALKTAVASVEYVLLRKDGKGIPVEMSFALSKSASAENLGWITVARDVSERKRVEEELRRLPRRISEAQEAERLRVARELHDGVNQVIASAAMRLRRVQDMVSRQNPAASELLSRSHKLLVQALEENRRIARNLRPTDLDELGLGAACRNICKEVQTRTGLTVNCQFTRFSKPLPPEVDLGLFRVVQEALNNVEKHARAKTVHLRIASDGEAVTLKIRDDGKGFDAAALEEGKVDSRGIGLSSLRERAAALGGTCELKSKPGKGTAITVRVPFAKTRRGKVAG
jgi:PAS domain S-box-containing protein